MGSVALMGTKKPGLSDVALVALGSGQTRVQVLLCCEQSAWTAADLAVELDGKRQTMAYHLRELERAGLVEEAGREAIAGGTLISYRATRTGWAGVVQAANKVARDPDEDEPIS